MTTVQILSLAAVLAAVVFTYLPLNALRLPVSSKAKPSTLKQIESVVAVREANADPAIISACNALLQAMLQVKA
jgi:hypothetical protein